MEFSARRPAHKSKSTADENINEHHYELLPCNLHLAPSWLHQSAELALRSSDLLGCHASLGFQKVADTDSYGLWFNDSSVMNLAETGTYKGAENIKEYAELLKSPSADFYEETEAPAVHLVHANENECTLLGVTAIKFQVNQDIGNTGWSFETVAARTFYYTVAPFNIYSYNVFYPSGLTQSLFQDALDAPGSRDLVCRVMENDCPETFATNGLSNTESCKSAFDSLPATEFDSYIDGNSKGCRLLHSVLAMKNSDHCAHLSFLPMEDPSGNVKCQESKVTLPSDLFSDDELGFIKAYGTDKGFPADSLYSTGSVTSTGAPSTTAPGPLHQVNPHPLHLERKGICRLQRPFLSQFSLRSFPGLIEI